MPHYREPASRYFAEARNSDACGVYFVSEPVDLVSDLLSEDDAEPDSDPPDVLAAGASVFPGLPLSLDLSADFARA